MGFLKKLFGREEKQHSESRKDGKPKWKQRTQDNPNAKWETRFWRDHRFTVLMNAGEVEHVIVFMYLLGNDTSVSSPVRKKEKKDCQKQLEVMFGEIDAPIKFTTTDMTVQEFLEKQANLKL